MGDDDLVPVGYDQTCLYCKQPYGVHDGLCASCVGRFSEGSPNPPIAQKTNAERDAAWEAEESRQADEWHREQERRECYDYS